MIRSSRATATVLPFPKWSEALSAVDEYFGRWTRVDDITFYSDSEYFLSYFENNNIIIRKR